MKKVLFLSISIAMLSICSCSSDFENDNSKPISEKNATHTLDKEMVKQNVMDFLGRIKTQSRSSSGLPQIKSIKPYFISSVESRGSERVNDTIFYVVDLENDEGFVLAAADERHVPIFAYIDENGYDEEKENEGFKMFVKAITDSYKKDGGTALMPKPQELLSTNSLTMVTPRVITKWGQQYPYGQFCSNNLAGPKNVALAQVCSFLMEPAAVSYYNNGVHVTTDINWESIISDAYDNNGDLTRTSNIEEVAHLMRYWGYENASSYLQGHTETIIMTAVAALRNHDFEVSSNKAYSASNMISDLSDSKNIILMRGYENSYDYDDMNGGYLWIIDGYFVFGSTKYLHCNWGNFGYHDGYYLDNVFDYMSGPSIETRFSGYYNTNLLYNVITKD